MEGGRNPTKFKNNAKTEAEYIDAAKLFEGLGEWKNSAALASECREKAEDARKDEILTKAKDLMKSYDILNVEKAINLFESIPGWKDSDTQIPACKERLEKLEADKEQKKIKAAKTKKKIKIISKK